MKIAVFTLPDGAKNPNVNLNDKYQFVDGKFRTTEQDAEFVEKILVGYNGCKLSWEEVKAGEAQPSGEGGDLSVASTKNGGSTTAENGTTVVEGAGKTTTATTENGENAGAGKTTTATTAEAAKPGATTEAKK